MKMCIIHNRYQCPGGEDAVVASESELLMSKGHEVRVMYMDNTGIKGLRETLRTAWRAPYSEASRDWAARTIADFGPDIVHVHNFFPLLTPSVYDACRDMGVEVVQTLHNYRAICPGAFLMRDGAVCEECIGGSAYRGALHGCYRGSRLGSLAVARMVEYHKEHKTWQDKVDMFIALTGFARSKFITAGFPPEKITVKPNFVPDPYPRSRPPDAGHGALYIGRLSREKGIDTLVKAWDGIGVPLNVLGDGPMMKHLLKTRPPGIRLFGHVSPAAVSAAMEKASFLVMPSRWYEGFPMVLLEAFAHGLPVIASRLGGMAEIVKDGVTGLHFSPGDWRDLAAKARWAAANPAAMGRMGEKARAVYREKYTPGVNYRALFGIYEGLLTRYTPVLAAA